MANILLWENVSGYVLELHQRIASRRKSDINDPVKALAIVTA